MRSLISTFDVHIYARNEFSAIVADSSMFIVRNLSTWPICFVSCSHVYVCLFELLLYVHGKQLRSCREGQLLNYTVPGQVSQRQFTSIKCPFFHQ